MASQEFWNGIPVVDDSTPMDHPSVNGDGHGCIPRDFNMQPVGSFGAVDIGMDLIPKSDWSAICREQKETKSTIIDILRTCNNGKPPKSLYQNSWGYCWMYSAGHALTAVRAVMGLPYKVLSPFGPAHIIKRGRNEGGWCGLSAEWVIENGMPTVDTWPNLKAGLGQDTPEMRADAAKNKPTEAVIDMSVQAYDRTLTESQGATLLLSRCPTQFDYEWWGHSVAGVAWVEIEAGDFGPIIWNSHSEDFESQLILLRGSKAKHMGATGYRVLKAA